ncbi:aldo/keto reductase [Halomonas denitrificans]|uniref:aldo/keto reductase n=1 Tax=Halomonas denitrificans TaxID=370769 RepID=UPI001CD2885E|nr:aldo/keto reductase [Halomonas denitrificans]MCA0976172.1 aldo/keto reductase [Halomonas denitrificans]
MSYVVQRLARLSAPAIGLGCMNVSHAYGSPLPEARAVEVIREAFDAGYRHFDTATLYGKTRNEQVVGQALKGLREEVFLASKCGMAFDLSIGAKRIDGRPETLRRQCEESLARLGTDHLDLYYLHRLDRQVPVEESVGELGRLEQEGKIGGVGLSEVSATTLRRAQAEHPVAAVQSEYSLWTRNPEIALLDACREAGTVLVAFSPLGRAFLTGRLRHPEDLEEGDMRRGMPRFSSANYAHNLSLLASFEDIAMQQGCTPAQLALAWLRGQGADVIPIPGSRDPSHQRENLAAEALSLDAGVLALLNAMLTPDQVAGRRYSDVQQADIDTEEFDPAG